MKTELENIVCIVERLADRIEALEKKLKILEERLDILNMNETLDHEYIDKKLKIMDNEKQKNAWMI